MNVWRLAGIFVLLSLVFPLAHLTRPYSESDPDRYYHLALSKIEATAGTVHTLPQASDLDWPQNFTDKEYLFHVLTRYAYRIAGDQGVIEVVPILVSAILVVILAISAGWGAFWPALVLELLFFFLSPHFYRRMLLLRPHLLAMLCFCGLIGSLMRGRPVLAFLSAFCFGLAYHSYFIPLLALGLSFPFGFRSQPWKRAFLGGLLGLTVGIAANPYFPETLQSTFLVLNEAMNPAFNRMLDSGLELLPLTFQNFVRYYWLHSFLILTSTALLWMSPRIRTNWRKSEYCHLFFLNGLVVCFFIMMIRSPRANEYLVPTMILFLAAFVRVLPEVLPKAIRTRASQLKYAAPVVLALFVAPSAVAFRQVYGAVWNGYDESKPEIATLALEEFGLAKKALDQLPADASGMKIFNCEWWTGSFIFYLRPDLRFVDANAPDFLWLANPQKGLARLRLLSGSSDAYDTVKDTFKAQYVLCQRPKAISVMEHDPHFKRLFPKDLSEVGTTYNFPFLYSVSP